MASLVERLRQRLPELKDKSDDEILRDAYSQLGLEGLPYRQFLQQAGVVEKRGMGEQMLGLVQSLGQGAAAGWSDELAGLAAPVAQPVIAAGGFAKDVLSGDSLDEAAAKYKAALEGDLYAETAGVARNELEMTRQDAPILSRVAELSGAVGGSLAGGAALGRAAGAASQAAPRVAQAAQALAGPGLAARSTLGSMEGALYGAGAANGDMGDRLTGAALGGTIGALAPGVAKGVGGAARGLGQVASTVAEHVPLVPAARILGHVTAGTPQQYWKIVGTAQGARAVAKAMGRPGAGPVAEALGRVEQRDVAGALQTLAKNPPKTAAAGAKALDDLGVPPDLRPPVLREAGPIQPAAVNMRPMPRGNAPSVVEVPWAPVDFSKRGLAADLPPGYKLTKNGRVLDTNNRRFISNAETEKLRREAIQRKTWAVDVAQKPIAAADLPTGYRVTKNGRVWGPDNRPVSNAELDTLRREAVERKTWASDAARASIDDDIAMQRGREAAQVKAREEGAKAATRSVARAEKARATVNSKVKQAIRELEKRGEIPTPERIAEVSGLSANAVKVSDAIKLLEGRGEHPNLHAVARAAGLTLDAAARAARSVGLQDMLREEERPGRAISAPPAPSATRERLFSGVADRGPPPAEGGLPELINPVNGRDNAGKFARNILSWAGLPARRGVTFDDAAAPEVLQRAEARMWRSKRSRATQRKVPNAEKRELLDAVKAAEAAHGVPAGLLLSLAEQESGYDRHAVSDTGATGPFQFTRDTAKRYGLRDRTDIRASADAAARLLRDLASKHFNGDIGLSLMAYNAGPKGVKRAMGR